jgi:hypothetical protein
VATVFLIRLCDGYGEYIVLLDVIAHVDVLVKFSCFPHVVNLACKAILSAISKLDYGSVDFDDTPDNGTFMDTITQDPIAAIRVLIKTASVICLVFLFDFDAIFIRFVHHHFADNTLPSFQMLFIRKISSFCEIWKSDGHRHY